jgi:hypothetical protein
MDWAGGGVSMPCMLLRPSGGMGCRGPRTGTASCLGVGKVCTCDAALHSLAADVWEAAQRIKHTTWCTVQASPVTASAKDSTCARRPAATAGRHVAAASMLQHLSTTWASPGPQVNGQHPMECVGWHCKLCCSQTAAVWSPRSRVLRFNRTLCTATGFSTACCHGYTRAATRIDGFGKQRSLWAWILRPLVEAIHDANC